MGAPVGSALGTLAATPLWKTAHGAMGREATGEGAAAELTAAAGDRADGALGRLSPWLQAGVVVPIWLLSRYYNGIVHDSRIYVGRALADLDPHGLGRDMLFAMDGQTRLTVYSRLIRPLVQLAGPSAASMALALGALLLWLAAAAWLASRIVPRGLVAAALICAAVLPVAYGAYGIFTIGEALATPRCVAEAGVMLALAALLSERLVLCIGLLVGAAMFHPLMAAPGFGVTFLVMAARERRWWTLAPLGLAALLVAALMHLGPAGLVFTRMDPTWIAVMHRRNGFLFLREWPMAAWSDCVLSLSTVLIASLFAAERVRPLLRGSVVIASSGLAVSFLLGDLYPSVLILQLQLWRWLWLVKALALLSGPLCVERLWRSQRQDGRLALVLLALSWCTLAESFFVVPTCIVALALCWTVHKGRADRVQPIWLVVVAACACGVTLVVLGGKLVMLSQLMSDALQAKAHVPLHQVLAADVQGAPILLAVFMLSLRPLAITRGQGALFLSIAAAALIPLAASAWDQRSPTRKMIDSGQGRASLNRLIGSAPNGVLWISDDVTPWYLLSRATWMNDLQGSVGTFSRPLAIEWNRRADAEARSGLRPLTTGNSWTQYMGMLAKPPGRIKAEAAQLCHAGEGPSAIIFDGDLSRAFGRSAAVVWHAPAEARLLSFSSGHFRFAHFSDYTVVHCSELSPRSGQPAPSSPVRGAAIA